MLARLSRLIRPRGRKTFPPFGPSAGAATLFASGGYSGSGQVVTPDRAMREATVAACVRILAESVAQLPLKIFQGETGEALDSGPLFELLRYPNPWQDSFQFREYMMICLCLRGNFYALMTRDRAGNVLELLPLHPDSVSVRLRDWEPVYTCADAGGRIEERGPESVLHVRGESLDGVVGFSPIAYHRETIGLSLAAEAHGGRFFRNGARPGGILTHPSKLSDEALEHLRQSWAASHGGENAGGTAILEEGMDFKPVAMTNEDAQYLETRKFQRGLICGIFRVPPHMVADLEKATFSNIEHQSIEFAKYSILPWAVRIETALMRHLLTREQRKRGLRVRLVLDGLERADIKTRYESYSIAIQNGILSANECRRLENRPPRAGGDVFLQPLNMTDGRQAGEPAREEEKAAPPGIPMASDADAGKPTAGGAGYSGGAALACACHAERSEASPAKTGEILRACGPQNDSLETKAADEDEDDEPEHDDWADAEWSPEAENINEALRKARGSLRRGWAEVVALDVREAGRLVDRFFPEDGKAVKAGAGEFGAALEALYRNLRPEMERKLERLYHDLAQDAIMAAAQQAGFGRADFAGAILDTVTAYTGYEVADYTASSLAQLRAIAREDGPTPARARLRERLAAWNARRPDKMSRVASVHAANWYVHETYKKCGVTKMRWVAQGGKTCPFCRKLDGKIVGVGDMFVPKGGKVSGNGATMITRRKIKHPPIHLGCVCVILPAFDPIAGVEKGLPMSFDDADGKRPNPHFNGDIKSPYSWNCQTSVLAFEARLRGYDVEALAFDDKNPLMAAMYNGNICTGWIDPDTGKRPEEYSAPGSMNAKQLLEHFKKNLDVGARCILYNAWKGTRLAHATIIFRDEEGIKLYDPQTGEKPITGDKDVLGKFSEFSYRRLRWSGKEHRGPIYLRVDNLRLNDLSMSKILKKRGG